MPRYYSVLARHRPSPQVVGIVILAFARIQVSLSPPKDSRLRGNDRTDCFVAEFTLSG
ncbi:MAG: hypothetical protein HYY41_06180, partial [Chloroflexi bacterium]|nr:hypothetical protein [Chloroflexota bacterium]